MPKTPKRPRDPNQLAKLMVDMLTGAVTEDQPVPQTPAQEFARSGGLKGGKARADALTPEQRRDVAAGISKRLWDISDIVTVIEDWEARQNLI